MAGIGDSDRATPRDPSTALEPMQGPREKKVRSPAHHVVLGSVSESFVGTQSWGIAGAWSNVATTTAAGQ